MTESVSIEMRARIRAEIHDLEIDYWHDVDFSWGRNAHTMYAEDGVFIIGDQKMLGPKGVQAFYSWREGRGDRVARHVVTNLRVTVRSVREASLRGIMCLFAADGKPVLPSSPPILVADVVSECVLGTDSIWRFRHHELVPLFAGGVPITLPPATQ